MFTVCFLFCFTVQVFIAQSRSSTRHRDVEDEELTRIFVMIPKTFSEEDLKDTFKVILTGILLLVFLHIALYICMYGNLQAQYNMSKLRSSILDITISSHIMNEWEHALRMKKE